MRSWLLAILGILVSGGIAFVFVFKSNPTPSAPATAITPLGALQGIHSNTAVPSNSAPNGGVIPTSLTSAPNGAPLAQASGTPGALAASDSPLATPSAPSSPPLAPSTSNGPEGQGNPPASALDLTPDSQGLSKATVALTTSQGVIKFKFYPKEAPKSVKRIAELISKGFYNGLTFHRVVPGFVIQGGDPTGTGTGGSGQKLEAEFSNLKHIEGTVAMARAADPNSADSQFYISLGTHPHLDHNYTIIGMVVQGMDVAHKIKVGDKMITLEPVP